MTRINFIDVGAGGGYDEPWAARADVIDFALCFDPNDQPVFEDKYIKYNTAVWDYDGEELSTSVARVATAPHY